LKTADDGRGLLIWVDCDACPRDAKDLVFKAAARLQIATRLVANRGMWVPDSPWIELIVVGNDFNEADDYIADNVTPGDLVITADIPLAARIVDGGALGIDPRGHVFDEDNVKHFLARRNLMADLREGGMIGDGPPPYGPKDRSRFASALDRLLTRCLRP